MSIRLSSAPHDPDTPHRLVFISPTSSIHNNLRSGFTSILPLTQAFVFSFAKPSLQTPASSVYTLAYSPSPFLTPRHTPKVFPTHFSHFSHHTPFCLDASFGGYPNLSLTSRFEIICHNHVLVHHLDLLDHVLLPHLQSIVSIRLCTLVACLGWDFRGNLTDSRKVST